MTVAYCGGGAWQERHFHVVNGDKKGTSIQHLYQHVFRTILYTLFNAYFQMFLRCYMADTVLNP